MSKKSPAFDIQKAIDQASPALELARRLASVEAPAQGLTELNQRFSSTNDFVKSIESASKIARRLSQNPAATAGLTEVLPKIALNLPNISARIEAALPAKLTAVSSPSTALAPAAIPTTAAASSQADMPVNSVKELGDMVRRLRERRKLSQQEFADLAGVGRRFLSELENGKPTLEFAKVLQVARAAGISLTARDRSL